ncbi:hypothetical protein ONE63_005807 [Megalurothrips usitatus]|uniref:Uncharacterized protein n=1 Tax=Megalurothrips usitatus TaxID=439358 RepID=A0AAV7XZU3_9NEOP|nr:hypothetical protein ONE63_005807 [Megalurothrips usitatus]
MQRGPLKTYHKSIFWERTHKNPSCRACGSSVPLRRCSSLRRRPCSGVDCTDANYRETVARLRMLLMDSYLPCRVDSSNALGVLVSKSSPALADFIARQEDYIQQLEKESQYCRSSLCAGCPAGRAHRPHDEAQGPHLGERGSHERRARLPRAHCYRPSPPSPTRCAGYSLRHGPDPAAVAEGARPALRVPHLRAAGPAHPGAHRVAVPAPPPRRLIWPPRPGPHRLPWPDPLGVWWGHLGWLRAELRAAPVTEDPDSGAATATATAADSPDPGPALETDPTDASQKPEPEARQQTPSPPPPPASGREPASTSPGDDLGDDETTSEGSEAAADGEGKYRLAQAQLALALPPTGGNGDGQPQGPRADAGNKPLVTVNVEVKFRVKDKKDRKRKKSSTKE